MGAQENRQTAENAYAAFSKGDAEGAMRNIDDSIEWITAGNNAISGTRRGKQAVGELWGQLQSKQFRTEQLNSTKTIEIASSTSTYLFQQINQNTHPEIFLFLHLAV